MYGQAERVLEFKRLEAEESRGSRKKIFAFTSGKGGTGKTFLSLNIAYALSLKKKILFIDLDQNLSNANIMVNEAPVKTLYSFFSGKNLLNELICETYPGLHFIFGDSGKLGYNKRMNSSVNQLFNQLIELESNYDFIFLDTGSGAGEEVFSILLNADVNIIVTNTEPTAIMDAYVMLKLLNGNNYHGEKAILINKCIDSGDGKSAFNNLELATNHFLNEKLNLLGTVDFDRKVSASIIAQELILRSDPLLPVCMQISKISDHICEYWDDLTIGTHVANIHQG